MAEVYFLKTKSFSDNNWQKVAKEIINKFSNFFVEEDRLAIKVHFGERQGTTNLNPLIVKAIYQEIKDKVEKADLVDCSVLYKGERGVSATHKKLALDKGFDFAPIEILDGDMGEKETKTTINLKHFSEAILGKDIENYNAILVISHFKGHSLSGFGGAIKNLGMGFAAKAGKLAMHNAFSLDIDQAKCAKCFLCLQECPQSAIEQIAGQPKINKQKCIGCGKCVAVCPAGAFVIPWQSSTSRDLQEKIVEYAFASLRGRKFLFVNVLMDITRRCDCVNESQIPFLSDIGILFSLDPIAIDQASLDIAGKDNFSQNNSLNPDFQLAYGEKIGLGKRKYNLIEIN